MSAEAAPSEETASAAERVVKSEGPDSAPGSAGVVSVTVCVVAVPDSSQHGLAGPAGAAEDRIASCLPVAMLAEAHRSVAGLLVVMWAAAHRTESDLREER